jgi:hypothetical protein
MKYPFVLFFIFYLFAFCYALQKQEPLEVVKLNSSGMLSLAFYLPAYTFLFLLHAYAIYSFHWIFFILSGMTAFISYYGIGTTAKSWQLHKSFAFLQESLKISNNYFVLISYSMAAQFLAPKYSYKKKNPKLSQFPVLRSYYYSSPQAPGIFKETFTHVSNTLLGMRPVRMILMDGFGLQPSHFTFLVAYFFGFCLGYLNLLIFPDYTFSTTCVLYIFMVNEIFQSYPEINVDTESSIIL